MADIAVDLGEFCEVWPPQPPSPSIEPLGLPDPPLPGLKPHEEFAHIFHGFLTQEECTALLDITQRSDSFRGALLSEDAVRGGYPDPSVRKSSMISLHHPLFADFLWSRLQPLFMDLNLTSEITPCGVNDHIRFLRYVPGEYFKPHTDGNRTQSATEAKPACESFLTMVLYLNEGFEGGSTRFHAMRGGEGVLDVAPRVGDLLVFDHQLYHEGAELVSGVKYILRTDVMFTPVGE